MGRRLFHRMMVLVIVAGAGVAALAIVVGERTYDGKTLLLKWTDTDHGIIFRITEKPGPIVKQNSRLHVTGDCHEDVVLIDDDAIFSTVALIRFERWLLVVCRGPDEVWAGYDYDAKTLYGEYQWSSLPFTRWSGQGTVVAQRKIHASAASPANFPRR
jgi:hypothetical protein